MIVQGNDSILFIKIGDDFVPLACITENGMSEELELLPTTTNQTNGWRTSRANLQSYNINFSGLQKLTLFGNIPLLSYDRLLSIKRNRILIEWREENEGGITQQGRGYIVNLTSSNPVNVDAEFSGTIQGYGEPRIISSNNVLGDGNENAVEDGNENLILV